MHAKEHNNQINKFNIDLSNFTLTTRSRSFVGLDCSESITKKYGIRFLQPLRFNNQNIFAIGYGQNHQFWFWIEGETGLSYWDFIRDHISLYPEFTSCEDIIVYPELLKNEISKAFNMDFDQLLKIANRPLIDEQTIKLLERLHNGNLVNDENNDEKNSEQLKQLFITHPDIFEKEVDMLLSTIETTATINNAQQKILDIFTSDFMDQQKNLLIDLGLKIKNLESIYSSCKDSNIPAMNNLEKNVRANISILHEQQRVIQKTLETCEVPLTSESNIPFSEIFFLLNILINTSFSEKFSTYYKSILYKFGLFLYNNASSEYLEENYNLLKTATLCLTLIGEYRDSLEIKNMCYLSLLNKKGLDIHFNFDEYCLAHPIEFNALLKKLLKDDFFSDSLHTAGKKGNPYALYEEIKLNILCSKTWQIIRNEEEVDYSAARSVFLSSSNYSVKPQIFLNLVNSYFLKDFSVNVKLAKILHEADMKEAKTYLQIATTLIEDPQSFQTVLGSEIIDFITLAISYDIDNIIQIINGLIVPTLQNGDLTLLADVRRKLSKTFYPNLANVYLECVKIIDNISFLREAHKFLINIHKTHKLNEKMLFELYQFFKTTYEKIEPEILLKAFNAGSELALLEIVELAKDEKNDEIREHIGNFFAKNGDYSFAAIYYNTVPYTTGSLLSLCQLVLSEKIPSSRIEPSTLMMRVAAIPPTDSKAIEDGIKTLMNFLDYPNYQEAALLAVIKLHISNFLFWDGTGDNVREPALDFNQKYPDKVSSLLCIFEDQRIMELFDPQFLVTIFDKIYLSKNREQLNPLYKNIAEYFLASGRKILELKVLTCDELRKNAQYVLPAFKRHYQSLKQSETVQIIYELLPGPYRSHIVDWLYKHLNMVSSILHAGYWHTKFKAIEGWQELVKTLIESKLTNIKDTSQSRLTTFFDTQTNSSNKLEEETVFQMKKSEVATLLLESCEDVADASDLKAISAELATITKKEVLDKFINKLCEMDGFFQAYFSFGH